MKIDFRDVDDVQSYVYVPPGAYVCRVAEVRPGLARDGSVRWSLRMEVAEGDQLGRTAAWDSLTWSDRGVARVKLVLKALGLPTHGVVEIEPQDLVGKRAKVTVQPEERENAQTGLREVRNRVPYAGFEALAPEPDEVPFDAPAGPLGAREAGDSGDWTGGKTMQTKGMTAMAKRAMEMDEDDTYAATQVSELGCAGTLAGAECGALHEASDDMVRRSGDDAMDARGHEPSRGVGASSGSGGGGARGGCGDGGGVSGGVGGDGGARRLSGRGGADPALLGGAGSVATPVEAAPAPKKRGRPRKHPLPEGGPAAVPPKKSPPTTPKPKGRGM